jgi:hypothetical protein
VTSDKGANFFYFPLISNTFFFFRVRNRSGLLESTDEMTDLIVIFSIRLAQIGKTVIFNWMRISMVGGAIDVIRAGRCPSLPPLLQRLFSVYK